MLDHIKKSIELAKAKKEREESLNYDIPSHPSVKTNKLLKDQLDFLIKSAEEARASDSLTRRIALRANTIAIIAAIMAIIAAVPVIIDLYGKFIK